MRIRPDWSPVRVRALRPRPRHAVRREGDERRAGTDWRGDRNRTDRDVDGGERLGFLLDLRVAPAQRRRGDRGPRDLKANRARLLTGVAEISEYFRVRLLQPEFDRPAAVRIQGLAIGIDVGDETTRTPSMTSAAATGCSCRPKDRRCCCCRRWRSTSGRRNSVAGCSGRFPQLAHPCRLITAPGKRASLTEIVDQH